MVPSYAGDRLGGLLHNNRISDHLWSDLEFDDIAARSTGTYRHRKCVLS